ncbi:hypothetical protein B566_EDAN015731 [Ephemera danica]|nr:hypothetical protein B566_EDAN015731 [Ephemera danica]
MEGIIKCKILPPTDLFHPVLPFRINDRLMFALCRTCAMNECQTECIHTDPDDRAFVGTWQMASGWPRKNMTEHEKKNYIESYKHHEGIDLDYDQIQYNAALRSLAKLLLNSLWEVCNIDSLSDEMVCINWKYREDVYVPSPNVNPVIAAYTTTFARIRLYKLLDQLGERILYYDTDSVIFTQKPGEFTPPTGEFLGELTDECADYGENSFITEFVSNGPKNYSYIIAVGVYHGSSLETPVYIDGLRAF